MATRFRRSKKIAPGTRVNFGKKSVGLSLGNRGGGVSFNSKSGVRIRASIPGTGLSFSSKIGSKKKKKGGLGLFAFIFLLPFYLMYYVCIFPFVGLFKFIKSRSSERTDSALPESADVANSEFERQVQIYNESMKLLAETKDPETFFKCYKDAEQAVCAMMSIPDELGSYGEPTRAMREGLAQQKTELTNQFLDRYAKEVRMKAYELTRGRDKKIESFKLVTSEYEAEMTQDSVIYRDRLYSEMLEKIAGVAQSSKKAPGAETEA